LETKPEEEVTRDKERERRWKKKATDRKRGVQEWKIVFFLFS
jgi:hypothetical protein